MDDVSKGPQPKPDAAEYALAGREPWLVHVDVYLESDSDPANPKFRVESCLPQEDYNGEKYFIFRNNYRPGFKILFQLNDMTGKGYTFPKRDQDAVWSKRGDECPDENWGRNEVFKNPKVLERDPTILRVEFDNEKDNSGKEVGRFRYTLNVTKNGAEPYLHLDPGGTGSNGPSRLL